MSMVHTSPNLSLCLKPHKTADLSISLHTPQPFSHLPEVFCNFFYSLAILPVQRYDSAGTGYGPVSVTSRVSVLLN